VCRLKEQGSLETNVKVVHYFLETNVKVVHYFLETNVKVSHYFLETNVRVLHYFLETNVKVSHHFFHRRPKPKETHQLNMHHHVRHHRDASGQQMRMRQDTAVLLSIRKL